MLQQPFFVASRNAKKAMEITGKSYDMNQWNGLEDNEVDFNQLERIVAKKKEQQQKNSNNKKRAREEDEDEEEDDEQEFPSIPGSTTNNNTDASFFSSFVDDPQSKRSRIDINQINETLLTIQAPFNQHINHTWVCQCTGITHIAQIVMGNLT